MSQVFADSINQNPIYATRAEQDKDGNQIDTTYATKAELPAAQVSADWEANSGVAQILHKPTIPSSLADITTTAGITDIIFTNALPAQPDPHILYLISESN